MKMLNFVDAAADQLFVAAAKINAIRVSDANTVLVYLTSIQDPTEATADDLVTLTATGTAAAVALKLSDIMAGSSIGGDNTTVVKAATAPFAGVSVVAYTVGA